MKIDDDAEIVITKAEMRTFQEVAFCPRCSGGELIGGPLQGFLSPESVHACSNPDCDYTTTLPYVYPRITYDCK